MNVKVVPYNPLDQQGVKEVVLKGFKEFGFNYNPKYDSDLDNPSTYFNSGGSFFVLKNDAKVIGTIAVINKGDSIAELKRMYVDKDYQKRGYGSLLFNKALDFCRRHNFKKLEFETNKKFTEAHEFYKKRGCEIVDEDERSYYMEKML